MDAEVLGHLHQRDTVFTGPGHSHNIVAELLGIGSRHGVDPSRLPGRQARSDVT